MKNSDFMVELHRFDCLPQITELADGKYDMDWCTFYVENIPYFIRWDGAFNIIATNIYEKGYIFTSMVISKTIPGNEVYMEFYCGNQKVFRIPVDKQK